MNQKYINTAAYYLAFILLGLGIGIEGPTLPKLAEHTSSMLSQISFVFFFGSLGYLLGSLLGGWIYDRVPGHRFMAGILVSMAILIALVPIANVLWVLLIIVLILGFTKGALDVGCNTLLLWVHNETVGPFMNGLHTFFGLGAFIAPLIVDRVISATGDIHWAFWILGIVALPIAAFIWSLPSPAARAVPAQHEHAPFPVLPVILMVLCFVLYVGGEAGYGNWIYTYTLKLNLGTEHTAAYLTSAFWGFFTLARLFGVWVSTRAKPTTILAIDFAGCLFSLTLLLVFWQSDTVLWVGTILMGISLASIFPTFMTLSEERMHVTGTIAGWFLLGGGAGGMILPWLIGQVFDKVGAGAMMQIILASMLLNLLTFFLFTRLSTKPGSVVQPTATTE